MNFVCKNRLKYKLNESEMNELKIPPCRKGDSSNISVQLPLRQWGAYSKLDAASPMMEKLICDFDIP